MIWVIGNKGLLGSELCRQLTAKHISWTGSDMSEADITNPDSLDSYALSHDSAAGRTGLACSRGTVPGKIKWVINCASLSDAEAAEKDSENAEKVNALGPKNIARTTRQIGAKLIHISTSEVYGGDSKEPKAENDVSLPVNIYGKTRLAGDEAVQKEMTQYYILRTGWLYGKENDRFLTSLIKDMCENQSLKINNEEYGSPVNVQNVAAIIIKIIETSEKATSLFGKKSAIPYGVYNYADNGSVTRYDFASKVYSLCKKYRKINNDCDISGCTLEESNLQVKQPVSSAVSTKKLQSAMNIKIPSWDESLEAVIKSI